MDRAVARRRHHEADNTLGLAEFLHGAVSGVRVVERQIKHRADARLVRQHAFAEPAIVSARQRDFDLDLRMQSELKHWRRKHHRDVDADCIHPSPRQRNVALHAAFRFFHAPGCVAHDAAAHVLVADAGRQHADTFRICLTRTARKLLQHRIVHVFEDFADRLAFVVMRVDIDDREILVPAFGSLLRGVRQQLAGVEFLDLHAAEIGQRKIHAIFPCA